MTVGIYMLTFKGTDKVYVGQSLDCIDNRYRQHLTTLRRQEGSPKLQQAYNIYGKPLLLVLEECSAEHINNKEIFYISKYDSYYKGFNGTLGGSIGGAGISNPNAKYSKISLLQSFRLLRNPSLSYKDIASITGVSEAVIGRMARGTLHNWIHAKYPSISSIVKNNLNRRFTFTCIPSIEGSGYVVKSPEGVLHTIDIPIDFCKKHNLTKGNLMPVLRGQRHSHRGWTLHKALEI